MSNKIKEVKELILSFYNQRILVTDDLLYIRYFVDFDEKGIKALSDKFGVGIFEDTNFNYHSVDNNVHLVKLQIDKKTAEIANKLFVDQKEELFEDPSFAKTFIVKAIVLERKKKDEGLVRQKLTEFVNSLVKKIEKRLNPCDRHVTGIDNIERELRPLSFNAEIALDKIYNNESTLIIANKNYTIKTPDGRFIKLHITDNGKKLR